MLLLERQDLGARSFSLVAGFDGEYNKEPPSPDFIIVGYWCGED